jgi:hypothetical protein
MPNQKLLEILQVLDKAERRDLQHFVESPYSNRKKYNRKKIEELLSIILDCDANVAHPKLQKEQLNQHFFPNTEYKAKTKNPIDSLASDLLSLVRKFILWEDFDKQASSGKPELAIARFYKRKGMVERFEQTVKKFRTTFEKLKVKSEWDFINAFQFEEEVAGFQSTYNTHIGDQNQVRTHNHLDNFYAISKMELVSFLLFQKHLGKLNEGSAFLLGDLLVEKFEQHPDIQSPLAKLYYQVIQLLKHPSDKNLLAQFEADLQKYEPFVPVFKYRNLVGLYRNLVGMQYQNEVAGVDLLTKLFELYRSHLEAGYFYVENDKIMPGSLKVLINFALKLNHIDWVKQLLKRYPPKRITGTRHPKEFHKLCLAEVCFADGQYQEAHDQIDYINFEDVNYSILADVLLIKVYYVLQHDLLQNRIRALEQKVRRTKLAATRKESYLNFLKAMYRIVKHRHQKTSKQWQSLIETVRTQVPLIEREWLMGIVME